MSVTFDYCFSFGAETKLATSTFDNTLESLRGPFPPFAFTERDTFGVTIQSSPGPLPRTIVGVPLFRQSSWESPSGSSWAVDDVVDDEENDKENAGNESTGDAGVFKFGGWLPPADVAQAAVSTPLRARRKTIRRPLTELELTPGVKSAASPSKPQSEAWSTTHAADETLVAASPAWTGKFDPFSTPSSPTSVRADTSGCTDVAPAAFAAGSGETQFHSPALSYVFTPAAEASGSRVLRLSPSTIIHCPKPSSGVSSLLLDGTHPLLNFPVNVEKEGFPSRPPSTLLLRRDRRQEKAPTSKGSSLPNGTPRRPVRRDDGSVWLSAEPEASPLPYGYGLDSLLLPPPPLVTLSPTGGRQPIHATRLSALRGGADPFRGSSSRLAQITNRKPYGSISHAAAPSSSSLRPDSGISTPRSVSKLERVRSLLEKTARQSEATELAHALDFKTPPPPQPLQRKRRRVEGDDGDLEQGLRRNGAGAVKRATVW